MSKTTAVAGIDVRHSKSCATRAGGACNCTPAYQAHVYDARTGKRVRRTFPTRSAAKLWRQDALVAVRSGKLTEARPKTTVKEVCEAWLQDARAGVVRTRGGDPYKPGTIRSYELHFRLRIYPELGSAPFYRVRRVHLQDIVDRQIAAGTAPATIGTMLGAMGAVYNRALQRDELELSPAAGVRLPAIRNGRTRFASPAEASTLLGVVRQRDRAIWATAMYAGLRRGELMALRWQDIDLDDGTIHVVRGWDREGPTTTKNRCRRRVPIAAVLREQLVAQRLRQEPSVDLVFGLGRGRPFDPQKAQERADDIWAIRKLERVTFHDCRHTFASFAIAAGVNAKALSTYLGHSSVAITFDRYGHLMPGSENEAAGLLDVYLATGA